MFAISVNYADDFVILSRGCAAEAKAWAAEVFPWSYGWTR
jgi:hypothetical protein